MKVREIEVGVKSVLQAITAVVVDEVSTAVVVDEVSTAVVVGGIN